MADVAKVNTPVVKAEADRLEGLKFSNIPEALRTPTEKVLAAEEARKAERLKFEKSRQDHELSVLIPLLLKNTVTSPVSVVTLTASPYKLFLSEDKKHLFVEYYRDLVNGVPVDLWRYFGYLVVTIRGEVFKFKFTVPVDATVESIEGILTNAVIQLENYIFKSQNEIRSNL